MVLLRELHREGRTIMMATHDAKIARQNAPRILRICDGVLVEL